jgi:hypothetical protein
MPVCKLCLKESELCRSHIVPKFLFDVLRNGKDQLLGINGVGNLGRRLLQDGPTEPLLCSACEQHINKNFEEPFLQSWGASSPLPSPWNVPEPHWVTVDYTSFKLFHLSVLFRAGVSSLPTFFEIDLGKHLERIRQMLNNKDPGEYWEYPVSGLVPIHHETKDIVPLVSKGQKGRIGDLNCYAMLYGGVQWWIVVSSHRNRQVEEESLRADGRIAFYSTPWQELDVMQSASAALRKARKS